MSDVLNVYDIPPSTNLIKVLSNSGYTIESALADIIDNSIAHGASEIRVDFHHKGRKSTIEVLDDGEGMNFDVLKNAMMFAHHDVDSERDDTDLGRYGVGMKTASSSFCHVLRVESKGSEGTVNAFEFPFDTKEWKINQVSVSQNAIPYESGTKVVWKDLKIINDPKENEKLLSSDIEAFSSICDRIGLHLSKSFAIYMEKGVQIYVNDNLLEPWNPFKIPNGDVSKIYEESSFVIGDKKVRVEGYLIPNWDRLNDDQREYATCNGTSSITDLQGFYVYRNNRLIVAGGWLGIPGLTLNAKFNFARIGIWFEPTAETDRYFRVNFIKNSVSIPEDFAAYLNKVAKIARSKSSNSYDYKKNPRPYKKHNKDQDLSVWNVQRKEHMSYFTINENHPLVQRYTEGLDKRKRKALFSLLAKEFPTADLSNGPAGVEDYDDEQLRELLRDSYDLKRKVKGMTFHETRDAILKEKPFSLDRYRNKVIAMLVDFLDEEEANA